MAKWLRYEHGGRCGFGQLHGETLTVYEGDMYGNPNATSQTLALSAVKLLCRLHETGQPDRDFDRRHRHA
ncbi:MAG: DUF2437 domain-containing protein [Betaproteobacteria bacterium]|nr:DUF2437 domain-containing protein [Betaproteobacteria bacterium]